MTYEIEHLAHALSLMGIEGVEVRFDEVYAKCPGHFETLGREDSNPSWHMNSDGVHNCWSCRYSGHLVTLVVERFGLFTRWETPDYAAAEGWITEHVGDTFDSDIDVSEHRAYIALPTPVPMTEARLAVFTEPPAWALRGRGISADVAAKYEVLWEPRNEWWITPVRHPLSGALMGWQEKGSRTRYFKNRPPTMKKSITLFGYKQWTGAMMVVVESPLDVAHIATVLGEGVAVATFGNKISKKQLEYLREGDPLVWAYDNDKGGREANESMFANKMRGLIFDYGVSGAKDPGEMTAAEIVNGVKRAETTALC